MRLYPSPEMYATLFGVVASITLILIITASILERITQRK